MLAFLYYVKDLDNAVISLVRMKDPLSPFPASAWNDEPKSEVATRLPRGGGPLI